MIYGEISPEEMFFPDDVKENRNLLIHFAQEV